MTHQAFKDVFDRLDPEARDLLQGKATGVVPNCPRCKAAAVANGPYWICPVCWTPVLRHPA